jgi:hypothetical protein
VSSIKAIDTRRNTAESLATESQDVKAPRKAAVGKAGEIGHEKTIAPATR